MELGLRMSEYMRIDREEYTVGTLVPDNNALPMEAEVSMGQSCI